MLDPVSTGKRDERMGSRVGVFAALPTHKQEQDAWTCLDASRGFLAVRLLTCWCPHSPLHAGGKVAAAAGKAPGGMMGPPASKTPAAFKTPAAAAGQQPSSSEVRQIAEGLRFGLNVL